MKRKIISLSLIFVFCFSFFSSNPREIGIVSASPFTPPQGWVFAKQNQKIPVSLDNEIYYAYELEKVSSNTPGGWLITDSENRIIYDSDTYQKLALTATVKEILDDTSTKTIMQNEISLLKSIKWRIDLYETTSTISKLVIDISTALTGNLFGYGGIEELFATVLVPIKSREGSNVQDKLFSVFSKQFVADATPQISKALGIIEKMSTSNNAKILKLFSILSVIIRKEAASFVRGGYEAYESAYETAQKSRSYWSYTEASDFLNEFEEGRTRGLPFAKWYLTLIPHSSNQLENIGSVVWGNVIKETLGGLYSPSLEDMKNFTIGWVDAMDFSGKFIEKTLSNELITSQLSDDIKSASAMFSIYSLYYDASTSGTLANQILSALQEQKGKEEKSIKDQTIYKIGDRVQSTDYINVRADPLLKGKVKSVIKKGEIGTIMSNYKIADGYRWWTVKWDSGPEGWCAGEYMKLYTSTATNQGKWVLVLGECLPVLGGISPAGHAIIGGECKEGENCWKTLSKVHSGDFLDYISTESATYSSSLFLSFPGCTKAYKVKDKNGNIGWLIGDWGGITLSQVVDSKITQNFKPVSFSKISGKWSGRWRGTFFEEGELSFVFQQEDMLTFKGTEILTLSGSDITKNVIVKGSIANDSFSFLEVQSDGSYKYCSGTISSDGKTIKGWKYSYDALAIPLGEFQLTLSGT